MRSEKSEAEGGKGWDAYSKGSKGKNLTTHTHTKMWGINTVAVLPVQGNLQNPALVFGEPQQSTEDPDVAVSL